MNEQGRNQRVGNTGASTMKALTKNAQPFAILKKTTPAVAQVTLPLPPPISTTTIVTVASSTTSLINTASVNSAKDFPSLTHPPQPPFEPAPPLKKKAQTEPPLPNTETPVEKSIEEEVTTFVIDDQQITKRRDTEATNEEEGNVLEFDEMLNMDILYGQGLPYPFILEQWRPPMNKLSSPEDHKDRRHPLSQSLSKPSKPLMPRQPLRQSLLLRKRVAPPLLNKKRPKNPQKSLNPPRILPPPL